MGAGGDSRAGKALEVNFFAEDMQPIKWNRDWLKQSSDITYAIPLLCQNEA